MAQLAMSKTVALVLTAFVGAGNGPVAAQPAGKPSVTASTQQQLDELKRLIEQQQQTIRELQQRVEELRDQTAQSREAVARTEEKVDETRKAVSEKPLVTSGQPKVKLAVSGHVNRAINIAGDGKQTKAYFVDNETSPSRVRFVGTGQATDDLTIGTKIELGIVPNASTRVSQDNEDAGDKFDERVVEVSASSKSLGTITLGKGSPAADGTSQVDLSGTDVVAYAAISDIAGGLRFRDEDGNLTVIALADAFTDYDSPRRERIRYDSPDLAGFMLSGSAISDQRFDAALRWGGQGEGIKIAGALALQQPNLDNVDLVYNGSLSALHEATGLSLTGSAGTQVRDDRSDPYNLYVKGGWKQPFFDIGPTAMSLDYTYSANRPANDDEGMSVGAALVQNISEYGTELFAGLRWYTLDTDEGPDLDDILVGTVGSRVKF